MLKQLSNINLDDIYWRLKVGKSKHRLTVLELRKELNEYIKNPIFFLSTGRCGTKWFSDLFESNQNLMVLHSPQPSLASQSRAAYNVYNGNFSNKETNLLKEVFFAGREQHLRYSYKTKKRYIETNNYITFFAPILLELFPDVTFVHLYRHPGEFVRSGIRRKYYLNNNPDDIKRPIIETNTTKWNEFSRIEKVSWLWKETNSFIESVKSSAPEKFFEFNFNNLNSENVHSLLDALNITIPEKIIEKKLNKKSNTQKVGSFPKYENWDTQDKDMLIRQCSELATKYGYKL